MSDKPYLKILTSIFLILVLVMSYTTYIDEKTEANQDTIFKRAFITFGLVKTLNGAISVVQGTEVAATPAGVGVTLTLGQVLDPVNDLIERFSWVMLISASSLAIQKVILEIGSCGAVKILLSLMIILFIGLLWLPKLSEKGKLSFVYKSMFFLVIIRFSIPVVALTNYGVYHYFLSDKYDEATTILEETSNSARDISDTVSEHQSNEQETSFFQGMKQAYTSMMDTLKIKERMQSMIQKLKDSTKYIINLITVFLLQSIIIPLAVLWLLLRLFGYIFSYDMSSFAENLFKNKVLRKRRI